MQLFEMQEVESRTVLTEQAAQKSQRRVGAERISVDSRWGRRNSNFGRRKAFLGSQHGSGTQIYLNVLVVGEAEAVNVAEPLNQKNKP